MIMRSLVIFMIIPKKIIQADWTWFCRICESLMNFEIFRSANFDNFQWFMIFQLTKNWHVFHRCDRTFYIDLLKNSEELMVPVLFPLKVPLVMKLH